MDDRDKGLSAAVAHLREELTRAEAVSPDVLQSLFDLVLTAVGRPGDGAHHRTNRPLIDARIARVLATVRERLSERWTVAKMARLAGMSRAAFIRLFKATTGTAPLTYVTRLRIEIAQSMLAETEEAAALIAERVGYGSVYAFTRAFTRLTGKPPVLFRRTTRGPRASTFRASIVATTAMRLAA
jgi:transcriptional regulator GlxA family with amidase domain